MKKMPEAFLAGLRLHDTEVIHLSQKVEPTLGLSMMARTCFGWAWRERRTSFKSTQARLKRYSHGSKDGLKGCGFCLFSIPDQMISQLGRLGEEIRRPPIG